MKRKTFFKALATLIVVPKLFAEEKKAKPVIKRNNATANSFNSFEDLWNDVSIAKHDFEQRQYRSIKYKQVRYGTVYDVTDVTPDNVEPGYSKKNRR